MYLETWGRPYEDSYCKPASSYNVINIRTLKVGEYGWKDTQDHSKWGITSNKDYTCYGDINMMTSQHKRGGGTLCMLDTDFHKLHKSFISSSDTCSFLSI